MRRSALRSKMRGLSLVEVMVSLIIGLVVVGAVLVSYLSSGKTSRQQVAYAEMNENAQLGLALLSRELLLAGYSAPTGSPAPVAPAVVGSFSRTYTGRAVFGCDNGFSNPRVVNPTLLPPSLNSTVACNGGGVAGTPAIEFVYQADLTNTVPTNALIPLPSDCLGNGLVPFVTVPPTPGGFFMAYNRFYLSTGSTGRSELHCASGQGGVGQPLVDNVDEMMIWYGEANPASPRAVARYVSAANLADPTFAMVVSVKICLLMRSSEPVNDAELGASPKYLDCNSVQRDLPDRFLRRAYFSTTTLRNKMAF
jgi:type IV pilus assembly protein PilW